MSVSRFRLRLLLRPVFYFVLFSFLAFGMWEWLQTPFFEDVSDDINTIVWFRLHCTLVDILILAGCAAVLSLIKRKLAWLVRPRFADLAAVSGLGVAYTAVSEYVNVYVSGDWGYSAWMPLVPFVGIGIVPLVQWLLLPPLILLLLRDHVRGLEAGPTPPG